jgi:probable F420-dependent oxidoreductase
MRTGNEQVRRGVVFPQGSIPGDPDAVREYVSRVADLGYDHLLVPDHILGVEPSAHPGWRGVYDVTDMFHEPLVLLGFLAAISPLALVTGVIVLPQRQAVVAAKQAAEVDLLSRGALRLGVGVGWNRPEFQGLGVDFASRGRRLDEQIEVMRALWTQRVVDFDGAHHTLHGVGISPLPKQRPIPVWIGAEQAPRAFRRVGRLGDGWMAMGPPVPAVAEALEFIRAGAEEAGRDFEAIGIQAWVDAGDRDADRIRAEVRGWTSFGATHISVNTRRGVQTIDEHIDLARGALRAFE